MHLFGPDTRPTGDYVTDVSDPVGGTINFSQELYHSEIGDGWETWSHGYTGDVYDTAGSLSPGSLTLSLLGTVHAFYFYAEPTQWDNFTITAVADDGTTLSQVVNGQGGATGYGFYTDGLQSIASIQISTTDTDGFAIAEFATGRASTGLPEGGSTLTLAAIALVSMFAGRARVRRGTTV